MSYTDQFLFPGQSLFALLREKDIKSYTLESYLQTLKQWELLQLEIPKYQTQVRYLYYVSSLENIFSLPFQDTELSSFEIGVETGRLIFLYGYKNCQTKEEVKTTANKLFDAAQKKVPLLREARVPSCAELALLAEKTFPDINPNLGSHVLCYNKPAWVSAEPGFERVQVYGSKEVRPVSEGTAYVSLVCSVPWKMFVEVKLNNFGGFDEEDFQKIQDLRRAAMEEKRSQ